MVEAGGRIAARRQPDQEEGADHRRHRQPALQGKGEGTRRLDRGWRRRRADWPPLDWWQPPAEWGVGAHAKHLRNLYVYFWRWATWKVFGAGYYASTGLAQDDRKGIVCFITVAGF